MLQSIKKFFTAINDRADSEQSYTADDEKLATTALIYHLIAADGHVANAELKTLKKIISEKYGIESDEMEVLLSEAKKREGEAVDLYGFTRILKQELSYDEKLGVLEMLWDIAYSDGIVHEFEDNIVWRVSELLGVSNRDRLDIRRQVATRYSDSQ